MKKSCENCEKFLECKEENYNEECWTERYPRAGDPVMCYSGDRRLWFLGYYVGTEIPWKKHDVRLKEDDTTTITLAKYIVRPSDFDPYDLEETIKKSIV